MVTVLAKTWLIPIKKVTSKMNYLSVAGR